jgi:hypothetical protein
MTQTITADFDGKVLVPDGPVELPTGRRLVVRVELADEPRVAGPVTPPIPADEWERKLFETASDCGVSLSDDAVSREAMYD